MGNLDKVKPTVEELAEVSIALSYDPDEGRPWESDRPHDDIRRAREAISQIYGDDDAVRQTERWKRILIRASVAEVPWELRKALWVFETREKASKLIGDTVKKLKRRPRS